jgi:predicted nucleic acid-binding protein
VLLPRIWDLRHNFTAYDAAYVALADALDASLLTRDRQLAASARGLARVDLV